MFHLHVISSSKLFRFIDFCRSRSVGRRRNLKHARKYKRVRGEDDYESDRGLRRSNLSLVSLKVRSQH